MESKHKKFISLCLRVGVAVLASLWVLKGLSLGQLIQDFSRLNVWVLLFAVAVQYLVQGAMAFRWWVMLRSLGIHIPYRTAVYLHFHGLFFNNFLPGAVGGDFIRAWHVTKHHSSKRFQAALSVFVDRFTGLLGTLIIAVAGYLLFMRGQSLYTEESREGMLAAFGEYQGALLGVLGVMAVITGGLLIYPKSRQRILQGTIKLWKMGKHAIGQLLDLLGVYVRRPWIGPFGIGLTIAFQSLVFISFWLIGLDLGVTDQLRYYFVFFPLVWVMSSVPVSPAAIGILEGGVVLLFVTLAGAEKEAATALALCQRVLILISSLPGVWIHLRASHLPREEPEFFIDEEPMIQ